jgi:hypothetical protein
MANWSKVGKWAAILTPIVGVGIYWYIKTQNDKAKAKFGEQQKVPTKPSAVTPTNTNTFPLKKGSKGNDYVKTLQSALGIVVDGSFGKDTLAALQEKANKSEIKDLQDLNDTIAVINAYNNSASRVDRILELLSNGQSTAIALNKNASVIGMDYDKINDMWTDDGTVKNLAKGFQFSTSKYQFKKAADFNTDVSGDLIIYTTDTGVSYSADSNNFDVV